MFGTCAERHWGSPSLLYDGYRVFPRGKAVGAWLPPPTPFRANFKESVELFYYYPFVPSWPVLG